MKLFDTTPAPVWPATRSRLYGELNRLAAAGLVGVSAEGPRRGKEYTVTERGRQEPRDRLGTPARRQPRRSEPLLKVFFLDLATDEQARAVLAERAERATAGHRWLTALGSGPPDGYGPLTGNGRIALEYALRRPRRSASGPAGPPNSSAERRRRHPGLLSPRTPRVPGPASAARRDRRASRSARPRRPPPAG
ncbi:PadR family transcriptional regulator [Streptomyces sp. NPDC054804]